MKVKRFLALLFVVSLLVCSAFAISASAGSDSAPHIASYNISLEGDFKFMVAVPKSEVKDYLTFSVRDTVTGKVKEVTKTVEQLESDTFADPVLNGVAMWAIRSDFQISAKNMGRDYELTVSTAKEVGSDVEVTSEVVTYSLAMYLNERLYKNGVILAKDGTDDADRRELYLAMLEQGHNAEEVLYNLDSNPLNDVDVFVDELIYSNISGKYRLYKPGDTATAPSGFFKVSGFSYTDGRWVKEGEIQQLSGEQVTLTEHMILSKTLIEPYQDGTINTSFAVPKLTYTKANGEAVSNATVWDDYYKTEGDTYLTDAAGNKFYDKFSLVGSFAGKSNVLRIQNIYPVQYEKNENGEDKLNEKGERIPVNPRNNAQLYVPFAATVVTDSVKANDVYVFSLDINVQSENSAAYQLVMRDTSGNAMFNLALAADGVHYYEEIVPGEVVDFEDTKVSTDLADLIFDKGWHNVRVEIGFNYRYTKIYVDDNLALEYIAGLQNTYDYAKAVESRRGFGAAELFVANDFVTDIYVDNISFTKKDMVASPVWTDADEVSVVSENSNDSAVFKGLYTAKTLNDNDGKIAIILGDVPTRAASRKANEILDKGVAYYYDAASSEYVVYNDSVGYVIFALESEVAIAYNNDEARDLAFAYFVENYSQTTLNVTEGELNSYFNVDAQRGAMYDSYLDTIYTNLVAANVSNADAIVKGISNIYGNMYTADILTWIASLYDPERGGFYYSNSARDTVGFYPDLESTSQAIAMLERLGIVSRSNSNLYITEENVGADIYNAMLTFVRDLQAEDGCFYHPQWESAAVSRVGRDIDSAIFLLGRLSARPYYDIPGVTDAKYQGIGKPEVTPASALTGKLSDSKISSVSKIVAAADGDNSSLPSYLQTVGAWATYIQSLGFGKTGGSYGAGNTISSIHRLVTQADNNYKAAKEAGTAPDISAYAEYIPNYETTTTPYVDYLENYVNSKQDLTTGFFEPGDPTWAGLNGLMKISAAYGSYGRTVQRSYEGFVSTLEVAGQGRTGKESACYIFNAWTCLNSMLRLVRTNASENFEAAKEALFEAAPELIAISYDVYSHHAIKDADGDIYGFSYYEDSPMNYSQSAHVAHSAYPEADLNSTMLATSSFLGVLFGTLNAAVDPDLTDSKSTISTIPLWNCYTDLDIFLDAWRSAPEVDKSIIDPETITFDDYIVDEEGTGNITAPHSLIYANVGGGNTSSVEQAPDKNAGDLAFKIHNAHAATGANHSYVYVTMVDEMRDSDTFYYEMDMYIEDGYDSTDNNGLFMQLLLMDGTKNSYQTGFNFYRMSDTSFKIQSSFNHPGTNGTHETVTVTGVDFIGKWMTLKTVTEKVYTEGVLTGLETKIYVGDGDDPVATFNDTFVLNDSTTDIENDIVDIDIGRVHVSCYRQTQYDLVIWLDNIYCGKQAK